MRKQINTRSSILGLTLVCVLFSCTPNGMPDTSATPTSAPTQIETILTVYGTPYAIAADDTRIYWSDLGSGGLTGSVKSAAKDGSAVVTLASGLYPPWQIAIDQTDVYWMSVDGIRKVAKTGGPVLSIVAWQPPPLPYTSDIHPSFAIALDDKSIYWVRCGSGALESLTKTGDQMSLLTHGRECPYSLVLDRDDVYWLETSQEGAVMRINKNGFDMQTLTSHIGGDASGMAVDSGNVYLLTDLDFFNHRSEGVSVVLRDRSLKRLAEAGLIPDRLVLDGPNLYWTAGRDPQSIMTIPTAGGTPRTLITLDMFAIRAVADHGYIYMTVANPGRIVRVRE